MILEALQHVMTPAPRSVKALGYVKEAIAIEARYQRCTDAWASHLAQCHRNILAATESLAPGSRIMIIGSGALHDVPAAELLGAGHNLILVDIVHLPKVRRRYHKHDRVQFMAQDVTGWVRPLFHGQTTPEKPESLPKADLVISLNILSQLPLNLVRYGKKHHISLPRDFAREVMAAHLNSLGSAALLICDMERHYMKDGVLLEKENVMADLITSDPLASWDWHIAPKGELGRDISLTHHVGCWRL